MTDINGTIFPLILNGSNLVPDTFNNTYRYRFPAGAVHFKNAKVAVSNVNMYYSIFNITAAQNNNTLSIVWPTNAGSTTYNITIPDGYYDITGLNSYLQQYCIQNGLYLVDPSGNYVYYFEFITNGNYYAVQFNSFPFPTALPGGWSNPGALTFPAVASTPQLIVNANAFRDIIGFNAGTYPAAFQATNYSKISDYTPQVTPIQSLIMTCSLLNNKYSIPNSILFTFTPAGVGFGNLIQASPNYYSYVDIQEGLYSEIVIKFLDQNFNNVYIRDTNLIIQLLIKSL